MNYISKRFSKKIETKRLLLRRWSMDDCEDLFEYASGTAVGPSAGWAPHKTLNDSKRLIRTYMSNRDCFAIELSGTGKVIGNVGLFKTSLSDGMRSQKASELGFSLNPSFWGNGYATEAALAVLDYGFTHLMLDTVWCGHFDFNLGSKNVCLKLGFVYSFERKEHYPFLEHRDVTEIFYFLTREKYLDDKKKRYIK